MKRTVRYGPSNRLTVLPSDRPNTGGRRRNSAWGLQLEGDQCNYEEPVAECEDSGSDESGDSGDNVDDGYCDDYTDDFESDDEKITDVTDEPSPEIHFWEILLEHGFRLLVPYDEMDVSEVACTCMIEMLTAERRTKLLSEMKHITDDVISDAYEVRDFDGCITNDDSGSKLIIQVVQPKTRLDHRVLYRYYVMARERNGRWKKVPADYQKSELTFALKGVTFFIAYAQLIAEFSDVTSSGFTFKSSKNSRITLEIPKGAVRDDIRIGVKMRPVNMDRLNAYTNSDSTGNDGIYALTDMLTVHHDMDTVLQREGSVRLPIDTVNREHDIKCLTKTSGKCKIVNIDRDQAVKDGQVEIPYPGDPKTSLQVMCTRPGAKKDKIAHDAAYLNGQLDSCAILFFLSKSNKDRYLTVEFVDKSLEEVAHQSRAHRFFYEIKNSRLSGIELGKKRRIRVELGGNMQSAKLTKNTRFTFIYNSGCKNNSIEFKTAKGCHGYDYSIVRVLFDGRKVHEIHFSYPDIGMKLEEIKNLFDPTCIYQRMPTQMPHVQGPSLSQGPSLPVPNPSSGPSQPSPYDPVPNPSPGPSQPSPYYPVPNPSPGPSQPSPYDPVPNPSPGPSQPSPYYPVPNPLPGPSQPSPYDPIPNPSPSPRPYTAITDNLSVTERGHPLLEDASLSILGKNLRPENVTELMIRADFKEHEIIEIRRTATATFFNPNMRLLVEWKRRQKNELLRSDGDTLDCLEQDFDEIDRADIAVIIKRLRRRNQPRRFKKKDFANL